MFRLLKSRTNQRGRGVADSALGPLEISVMEILWAAGESSVRDVCKRLRRPLAYTTVMTTLERLFKKLFLDRRKSGRAFLYSPRLSRQEWEHGRAGDLVAAYLDGPQPSRDLLVSSLVDAVGQHDEELLEALERKIQERRLEISRRGRK
ncbi:MAG: BlaI/MecI/CopY family transcriptional regulator [Candidatus Acidiferrales bacterium]